MNIDEKLVLLHLNTHGYNEIIHEPDGNIPPDFLVNGEIAIEVRRLNKYIRVQGGKTNIEDLSARLYKTIEKILGKFKDKESQFSNYVICSYRRPLIIDKELKNKIINICEEQLLTLNQFNEYEADENLIIRFLPTDKKLECVYKVGGMPDFDAGGFVISEICKNLGDIIQEKEKKIMPHKYKYKTWWLALVDRIGWGISEDERNEIRKTIHPGSVFDKVLIINPVKPDKGIFL